MKCDAEDILLDLSKKWTLLILKQLEQGKPIRFNSFLSLIDITPKILNKRLEELEKNGIILRKKFNEIPPRVQYSLTTKGKELIACFAYLDAWSKKYTNSS